MRLSEICSRLNTYLEIVDFPDYPNALNGLQLENDGEVSRIGAAVDASAASIESAIGAEVDFLLVHHGLFWGGLTRLVGPHYQKVSRAISNNLSIYSAHLPLDAHPEVGNNILLSQALGFRDPEPFFSEMGRKLGLAFDLEIDRQELVLRLQSILGPKIWLGAGGPKITRRVGIVTGGAGSEIEKAAQEGVDTFITGEGPHHTFVLAEELGINLIYAGHYATETFGVRALAEKLSREYRLPHFFFDHPSGL